MKQSVQGSIGNDPNIAAASAIASGWTTTRDEFLTAKRSNAIAPIATLYTNFGAINKHLNRKRRRALSLGLGSGVA
jgi:hypothetical protein